MVHISDVYYALLQVKNNEHAKDYTSSSCHLTTPPPFTELNALWECSKSSSMNKDIFKMGSKSSASNYSSLSFTSIVGKIFKGLIKD